MNDDTALGFMLFAVAFGVSIARPASQFSELPVYLLMVWTACLAAGTILLIPNEYQ
jgi:hypothetical protein